MSPRFSPIIVSGMHRSGTSLTASLLSALGIDLGSQLLPRDSNNRRGYFEDTEFLELQRTMLATCSARDDGGHPDWGWTESDSLERHEFKHFLPEARALIARRDDRKTSWGWKDPRTTLLLDFWDELLDDARYVLVYRFPWDVADSMQRLGAEVFLSNPEYTYRIWRFYNQHIHDFCRRNSDRCVLVSINALPNKLGEFKRLLCDKLGLQVGEARLEEFYESDMLSSIAGSDPLIDLVAAVWPDCTRLLEELDEMADISGSDLWRAGPVRSRLARPDSEFDSERRVDLSVVTPCYEQGTLLIEAIASVERFAPEGCELIIVNDGSQQPRTIEILQVLRHCGYFVLDQPNLGLPAARNAAITLARGRYILPLDDDNRIRANFIEDAIRVLDASPDVGVVYGDRYDFGLRTGAEKISEFDLNEILMRNYVDACAVFRKQLWTECEGYDSAISLFEDWEFWIHAARLGWQFYHLPYVAFDYRVRPGSLITRLSPREIYEVYWSRIRRKHLELFIEKSDEQIKQLLVERAQQPNRHSEEIHLLKSEGDHLKAEISEKDRALNALKDDAALKEREVQLLKEQLESRGTELAILSSELAEFGSLKEQLSSRETELAILSAELAELGSLKDQLASRETELAILSVELAELGSLKDQLASRETELVVLSTKLAENGSYLQSLSSELARIKSSLGWRLLSRYGKMKYKYLLPIYSLLGLGPRDESHKREE